MSNKELRVSVVGLLNAHSLAMSPAIREPTFVALVIDAGYT